MTKLVSVVLCCIGLAFGPGAALAGAAHHSGLSVGQRCAALKKEMTQTPFRLRFGDSSGQHAMTGCKAELG